MDTTPIHRVVGLTGDHNPFVTTCPCPAQHRTICDVGLIGGGHVPMPGEGSLAHKSLLLLAGLLGLTAI